MNTKELILQLHQIQAIEFGQFKLKSGVVSPFYLDLRKIVSFPKLLQVVSKKLANLIKDVPHELICGVPYAALSFATGAAMELGKPMIMKRKERKKYGTKKIVEGVYEAGQSCLVIEDTVTSGISLIETFNGLEEAGLKVNQAAIIVDRLQGGVEALEARGYEVHTLLTIQDILDVLLTEHKIDVSVYEATLKFIESHQVEPLPKKTEEPKFVGSYESRIPSAHHAVTKRLLNIIKTKKTNLIHSADVTTKEALLDLAEQVGPHICALKTHTDILPDFNMEFVHKLKAVAKKHNFLLFEDRKFCDIGSTVQKQFLSPLFNIPTWADMITIHVIGGESTITALKATGKLDNTALIIVAQMSTKDTLTSKEYVQKAKEIGEKHKDVVMGFVAQQRLSNDTGMLQFTPGINLQAKGDAHGQTYNSPAIAFQERGTDVMIVGRGIYQAKNPMVASIAYKQAGWQATLNRNLVTV